MIVEVEDQDKATILKIHGRIDANSAPELEKRLTTLIGQSERAMVLDFSATVFVSSAGLRVFLLAAKKLKASARPLLLCALNANIMDVMKITGFHRVLNIRDNLPQALAALD